MGQSLVSSRSCGLCRNPQRFHGGESSHGASGHPSAAPAPTPLHSLPHHHPRHGSQCARTLGSHNCAFDDRLVRVSGLFLVNLDPAGDHHWTTCWNERHGLCYRHWRRSVRSKLVHVVVDIDWNDSGDCRTASLWCDSSAILFLVECRDRQLVHPPWRPKTIASAAISQHEYHYLQRAPFTLDLHGHMGARATPTKRVLCPRDCLNARLRSLSICSFHQVLRIAWE